MTFKELIAAKNITSYALAKKTGIPYTTISDLLNHKTTFNNVSLRNAILISKALNVKIESLLDLEKDPPLAFRYFRNNTLHELRRVGDDVFINKIIKSKTIDYYHKNNEKEKALYLLSLIDYLSIKNGKTIYNNRYNEYRKEKLEKPLFVGSDIIQYENVEEAEKDLGIKVIPEFKKYNIIEEDVYNVA